MALTRFAATLALALALTTPADAWHDRDAPPTGYSAEALRSGEWRIYPSTLIEYGVLDGLELGTVPALYFVSLYNAQAKGTLWRDDSFAVALSAGVFTLDPNDIRDDWPSLRVWLVPVGLHGSYRSPTGEFGAHLALRYATATTNGTVSADDSFEADALLDGSSLVLSPTFEWRTSRSFAWVFEAALSLWQSGQASGGGTYRTDDGRTTVEVFGDGSISTGAFAYGNVSASAFWSWETFNLRLGLGYGHYDFPLVGLFWVNPSFFPELNLFWRF